MSSFSPALESAIQQPFFRGFVAVQVTFPDHQINLIDGSGFVVFNGTTFSGYDSIYGTIGNISTVSSAFATQAPNLTITFMPPNVSGVVGLNNPLYQLAPVNVWLGVVNEQTGQVSGAPYLMFSGVFDFSKSTVDAGAQTVAMNVVSVFDRMFVAEEASRLNQQYHQTIHPTETGLALNVQAAVANFWGQVATTNPQYPVLPIAPTLADRLSGQGQGGSTYGNVYPGF